ncbi:glycosyltransferase family 2 protein [Pseudarthrobacter sp. MDT3-28]|uniref:glycosyltransferase family 2 protein n=1 Tax=Pseudarthrobacter raffinosi TaxID=2953651 RepID=UPI00208E791F|nr:glycosyltransferase family 2 protein [Pseudarthrobacter sp. MDT3-28]MCO4239781.1 glycosyltransferase family 2 protein [Pseudarthrobacter sp. MDT3-28]
MVLSILFLYSLQDFLWPASRPAPSLLESSASIVWISAFLPGICGLIGMLAYRHPGHLNEAGPIGQLVVFRIVSRGTNSGALESTILRCVHEMRRTPLFKYWVEVVIEDVPGVEKHPQSEVIRYLVIPRNYSTPKASLYKARALQYALEASEVPDNAWLVHLDEETQPTSSGIRGISQTISEEEESGRLRVGQGVILYHRDWKRHPILTLADNIRTGDDFARFHFQHRIGLTIFGLHGSFIVVRNDVEKSVGFDFGPEGSITEDAFWALKLMEAGGRARWVDGYLEEQSTQSVGDFIRQRRRWYQGLIKVAIYAPVKLRWRAALGANTLLWTFSPFAIIYTVIHFLSGFEIVPWVRALANFSVASFITLYVIGLAVNLNEHGITNRVTRAGWFVLQIVLVPVFSLIEAAGVMMALMKPVAGFHVVEK